MRVRLAVLFPLFLVSFTSFASFDDEDYSSKKPNSRNSKVTARENQRHINHQLTLAAEALSNNQEADAEELFRRARRRGFMPTISTETQRREQVQHRAIRLSSSVNHQSSRSTSGPNPLTANERYLLRNIQDGSNLKSFIRQLTQQFKDQFQERLFTNFLNLLKHKHITLEQLETALRRAGKDKIWDAFRDILQTHNEILLPIYEDTLYSLSIIPGYRFSQLPYVLAGHIASFLDFQDTNGLQTLFRPFSPEIPSLRQSIDAEYSLMSRTLTPTVPLMPLLMALVNFRNVLYLKPLKT